MAQLAPRRGPDRAAMFTIFVAEMIVLREEVPVLNLHPEEVVDFLLWRDAGSTIGVGLRVRHQILEHVAPDEHEARADVFDLERLVGADHVVPLQLVQVEDPGQRREVLVVENRALPHALPVDALHGNRATNDPLVSLDHQRDVVGPEALVCVDEQEVRGAGDAQEVVRDGVATALDQALIPKEDAGQLDAVLHAGFLEGEQRLCVL